MSNLGNSFFPQKPDANPIIYAYEVPDVSTHKGYIKIGYTTRDAHERIREQLHTSAVKYNLLGVWPAMRNDGTCFKDHDVHKVLKRKGYRQLFAGDDDNEWYKCSTKNVEAAIVALKTRSENIEERTQDFKMRPEQEEAVGKTLAYYDSVMSEGGARTPKFLWNAKMRFGKTFAAYQLAKRMGAKRVLVLTFKPAVRTAWYEDLMTHVDFEGWQFVTREGMQFEEADPTRPIVCFGSFQDFLGRDGGQIKARNEWVHLEDWDLVIFDEYHFGAWNDNSKGLFSKDKQDNEDERDTNEDAAGTEAGKSNTGNNELDETDLPILTKYYLFLSGTPFRALNSGEFIEEQVYNWTYSDEQSAKASWPSIHPGEANPYEMLPRMVMLTYQLPEDIRKIALGGEYNTFDLNVFFEAEGEGDEAQFKLKDYVQKWLDIMRGASSLTLTDDLKMGAEKPPMPYSDSRLLNVLNHTLWYLPRVNACYAMRNLLKERQNVFFHDYKINVCAGTEAGVGAAALDKVQESMEDPLESKTITLTCGKLTTGVTVKPWTGIFMLTNMKSPETYFQAAFRVQSPWMIDGENGKEIVKQECYVFDFALDRALRMVSDYSIRLSVDEVGPERKVGEFISFLPVLAFDGSTMKRVDASEILDIAMAGTSATLLARRWESALLVYVDNETLRRIIANEDAMRAIMNIEGFRSLGSDVLETIVNRSDAIKKAKREAGDDMPKKEKKQLTDEEKELKSKRKQVQEKLIKFATRIPIFMYLTDRREETLYDVITKIEPNLFKKVTGLSVADFQLLVDLGVFNFSLMNDAVYKFRRYEDSSLAYTGINKHAGESVGLFDTTLSAMDYELMRDEEQRRGGVAALTGAGTASAGAAPVRTTKSKAEPKAKADVVSAENKAEQRATKEGSSASELSNAAGENNKAGFAGRDWIVDELEAAGFKYTDLRSQGGALWVVGSLLIKDRLKPVIEQGANFRYKLGGGKATKGKDAWWLKGYPTRLVEPVEEERPLVTQEQLDAIETGDTVFHKSFGYGEVADLSEKYIWVRFDGDKDRIRQLVFPATFYQGLLQLD